MGRGCRGPIGHQPDPAAAGLASLDIFANDRVIAGLAPKIELLAELLSQLADHPHVGDIRRRGLMVGIELVQDKGSREAYPVASRVGHRVILAARAAAPDHPSTPSAREPVRLPMLTHALLQPGCFP